MAVAQGERLWEGFGALGGKCLEKSGLDDLTKPMLPAKPYGESKGKKVVECVG